MASEIKNVIWRDSLNSFIQFYKSQSLIIFHVVDTDESESPAKQNSGEETQETAEGTASSTTAETQDAPRENRLSSLLSGRRRANVARRPGTLLPSTGKQSSQDS